MGIIITVSRQLTVENKVGSFWWLLKENTTYAFLSRTSQRASGIQDTYLSPSAGWDLAAEI